MAAQIFISYRRTGGDTTAKLICETLKGRGYSVFYDFDTLKGGYFDTRLLDAIEECNDVVLVLPPNALDRCVNDDDWVRQEIRHALLHGKNIIPVMMKGFEFPKRMPEDISDIQRFNGVLFYMEYFDSAIDKIVEKLSHKTKSAKATVSRKPRTNTAKIVSIACGGVAVVALLLSLLFFTKFGKQLRCSHAYSTSATAPTCTENGYTTYFCAKCEKTTEKDFVPALGHSWGDTVYEITPSCTESGRGTRTCTTCEFHESATLDALGHKYGEWIVDVEATKTESGLRYKDCSECGERFEEIIYPAGSAGLKYQKDGDGYAIVGLGSCTDEHIIIPPIIDGNKITKIADNAFKDCKSILSVEIPEGVTSIGKNAFNGCISLTDIVLPSSVAEIGKYAFCDCKSLESIIIPDGITEIGSHMFKNCSSMTSITIPKSVTKFGQYSLEGCRSLDTIHYLGTKVLWREISFGTGSIMAAGNYTVYCTDGTVSKFDFEGIFGG